MKKPSIKFLKHPINVGVALALGLVNASATEYSVTENLDDGTGLVANTLSWAILQANTNTGADQITLESDVTMTGVMKRLINSDVTLTSDSTPRTISGNNQYRPLFIKSGEVKIENVNITNGLAKGGDSGRAHAGAGMGGALFIYNGRVTLSKVTISDSSAIGGVSSRTGRCYSKGGGMLGHGMFDLNGNYGGYGLYQTNDPKFGQGGLNGEDGGFGGGGGTGYGDYTEPGNGGFGAGGGTGLNYYGGIFPENNSIPQGSCGGGYYYYLVGTGGFGSGSGYGGASHGAGMGGGLFIRGGRIRFEHTTISNNHADATNHAKGLGGGVFIMPVTKFDDYEAGSNNSGLPNNLPRVKGCRLLLSDNAAKSQDENGQTTDDVFDVAELFNSGAQYPYDDFCLSISGNDQFIENNDNTTNVTDFTHFGSLVINTAQAVSHRFAIKNHSINQAQLTGNPLVAITGDNAGDFVLTSTPNASINSDEMTEFEIKFQPTQPGYRRAQVEIEFYDGEEGMYTFAIDGQGLVMDPEIELRGNGETIINGSLTPNAINNTEFPGTPVMGEANLHEFEIHNSGNDELLINGASAVEISGSEANSFHVSTDIASTVIAPDDSVFFEITFDPIIGGQNAATVVIQNNDSDESPYTFNIAGLGLLPEINVICYENINGTNIPISIENGSLEPLENCTKAPNTFFNGTTGVGFNILNEGNADLLLTNNPIVQLTNFDGDNFSTDITNQDFVIAPGSDLGIFVDFHPISSGHKTALVQIANTDEDESPYEFIIHGLGVSQMAATNTNPENTVTEGETVVYELVLSTSVDIDVAINYETRVFSSAVTQDDLVSQPLNGQVVIPANTTRVPLNFEILADGIPEGSEHMLVRFSSTNELIKTSSNWVTPAVTITDCSCNQDIFANGFDE